MPVGQEVEVVVIRNGKELTKTVTLGRLEDGEKKTALATENNDALQPDAVAKALGMEFSALSARGAQDLQDQGRRQGRGRDVGRSRLPPRRKGACRRAT